MTRSLTSQLAVNVLAQGLARIVSMTANLVLLLTVARVMGVHYFGQFSYVMAFSAIIIALADMGTTAVLSRGLAFARDEDRARYLGNYLLLRFGLLSVAMLAGGAAALLLSTAPVSAMLIIVAGMPALASRFFEPIYQVYGRPWMSLRSNLVFAVAQLAIASWVWFDRAPGLDLLVACVVASNALYAAIATGFMLQLVRPHLAFDRATFRSVLALAGPVGVSALFTTVISRSDVLMIDHFLGASQVGLYSAAARIIDLALLAAVTIVTPMVPVLTVEIAQDRAKALARCRSVVQFSLALSLPVAVVAPFAAAPLIELALGSAYSGAALALTILVWNFVLIIVTLVGSSVNLAIGEVRHAYWNTPIAAVLNVGLNAWLIPSIGITGAAISAICAQLAMMSVSHYYTFTRFGSIYDARGTTGLVLLAFVLALFVGLAEPWAGWAWAACAGLALYAFAVIRLGLVRLDVLWAMVRARRAARPASP